MKSLMHTWFFLIGFLGVTNALLANDIFVKTTQDQLLDDGQCSLREALSNAQTNSSTWADCEAGSGVDIDVIQFDNSLSGQSIELQSDLPVIDESLSIIGLFDDGPAITLDGVDTFSLITIGDALVIDLQNLILTRARDTSGSAIDAPNTMELVIRRSRIESNVTTIGPVIDFNRSGPGVGVLTIVDSVIRDNLAEGTANGKILRASNSLIQIDRSEISGNLATGSVGGSMLGFFDDSTLTMLNSTISGNRLQNDAAGSALSLYDSHADLVHVTIADNRSNSIQRSVFVFASASNDASLDLINSILISQDESDQVCTFSGSGAATLTETGTFSTSPTCLESSNTVTTAELALEPLSDNGGLTRTHALDFQSVVIDAAGDCSGVDPALTIDQRSEPRPGINSTACDAGAFEVQLPVDLIFDDAFET